MKDLLGSKSNISLPIDFDVKCITPSPLEIMEKFSKMLVDYQEVYDEETVNEINAAISDIARALAKQVMTPVLYMK